ncbi:penicillin-binding protein 1C [Acetobacter cibinongensis]|uniref:peptidoglycan glycosyltransferase n=2 Tax=Acetobacter cibinongensis TaxID=146475 RepID=A0A0D6N6L5_9PROT|nr:penicillin binding protein 1C [Acetobacter cibinongensis]GEL59851.1 penicillin-binding protein 1C [Acetobacter cibinongensis]
MVLVVALAITDRLFPPRLTRAAQASLLVYGRDGALLDGHTSADGFWRVPTHASDVDPLYLSTLFRVEDHRFYAHPGIDLLALGRAFLQILVRHRIVSGGSTLAMQTARLLTPHRHTLVGKIQDLARALQLEWRYGRAGVLDLYLTLAPEGRNIEGIRAASLLYFSHEPSHLSAQEAAFLVALPRRPAALRPDKHPHALIQAAQSIVRSATPPFSTEMIWVAPVFSHIQHNAPELTEYLATRHSQGVVHTTIDTRLQHSVWRITQTRPAPLRGTFAALIVNRDQEIVAWVGGAEHTCPGCAINMVTTSRSPGSTLKPFIYGMAFEAGWLTPQTRIDDRRMALGGYAPFDFGHAFTGETTVAEALQLSLNVPAVQALQKIGPRRFVERLAANGVTLHLPHGGTQPGLAVALGGGNITLADLTRLYTAFTHSGMMSDLVVTHPFPSTAPTRLLTSRASSAVRDILRGTAPPQGLTTWHSLGFKTGTSYGNRDAWAFATLPQGWTVGVWAGRPDGTAVPGMTGRDTAGPVLADIASLLMPATAGSPSATQQTAIAPSLSPALIKATRPKAPQIIFPKNHSEIESRGPDGTMLPVGLEASGRCLPFQWFVNGAPLPVAPGTEPVWYPSSPGFAHLTVVDSCGKHADVSIRVR